VNAIFGCLLSLGGGFLLIQDFANRDYKMIWLPLGLLLIGLVMLLRHRSYDDALDLRDGRGICSTCRGAGTVYSAEWNDWRKSGPIQNIRELCPSCQGMNVTESTGSTEAAWQQPDSRS
jgi:hypothetical protein